MLMNYLRLKLPLILLFAVACGSSSSSKNGAGGSGGVGGTTLGGTGGAPAPFKVVEPCLNEGSYAEGATTITFPNADMTYAPKCLKVAAGATVTFMASEGTFAAHPLEGSRRRGDTVSNPITTTQGSSMSRDFVFTFPGFYAYYCNAHGVDDGSMEAGVIWVH